MNPRSHTHPSETEITDRARACGLELPPGAAAALAEHARSVLANNERLHLTTIVDPDEYLERHLGEAFEGAALLDPGQDGILLDLGSGNGYPGLPIAAARPGLRVILAEASVKKAGFLLAVLSGGGFPGADVLERQIQRSGDLEGIDAVRILVSRAMGAWEKIVPRLAASMEEDGQVLLWAGEDAEPVFRRKVWQRFRLIDRHILPGRERSCLWVLQREPKSL